MSNVPGGLTAIELALIISDEMIPESRRQEFAREATAGLMAGFVLMMFLDAALG